MKKIITAVLSVWLVFILQTTVFTNLNIGGIVPNIMIILTATWGFMEGDRYGLAVGFACGLLADIFFGSFIGLYAVLYMYIGYLNGKFCNMFYQENVKLPLALITVSDLLYGLGCYIFLFLLRGKFDFWYYFQHICFPEMTATLIVALIQYPLSLFIHSHFLVKRRE